MRIVVVNRQSAARVNMRALRRLASHLAERLTASATQRWAGLTVIVTDDSGILTVKSRCFGKALTTDVVAAAYAPIPGEEPCGWTADVIINAQRASKAARYSATWTPSTELALYLAHGIDHLCGGRDHDVRGRMAMRRRDLRWIKEANLLGLVAPLLRSPGSGARNQRTHKSHAD